MKVALIGNMNQTLFVLTRLLRDYGFNAHLFLLNEPFQFKPESDTFENDYINYTHQLNWNLENYWSFSETDIRSEFEEFNFFIGCDFSPAYLYRANIKLDIFIPFGSDIYLMPFKYFKTKNHSLNPKKIYATYKWNNAKKKIKLNQRHGIEQAKNLIISPTSSIFEFYINKLKIKGIRHYHIVPSVYLKKNSFKSEILYKKIEKIKSESDILIFHHCRHQWLNNGFATLASKGNDILFRGCKLFKDNHPKIKIKIVTLEYGPNVNESKMLISELGLDDQVIWFPITQRKYIIEAITLADMGVGELGESWYTYGVIQEFMAMGIPIIHNLKDKLYEGYKKYPMIHASNENDILKSFELFLEDPKKVLQMGNEGKYWYEQNIVKPFMDLMSNLISKK
jgi:glycosyltransferase involved in cell wall biosynthesis